MGTSLPRTTLFLALTLANLAYGAPARDVASAAYQQAIANARAGNLDVALPMLERLVQQQPGNLAYRYDWIAVLSWADRHAEALRASYHMVLTPKVPDYVVSAIGKSGLNGGQPGRAEDAYRILLARHPQDADASQGLTMALQAQRPAVQAVAATPAPAPASGRPDRDWGAEQEANGAHIRAALALLDTDFTPARYRLIDAALAENHALAVEAASANQTAVLRRLRLDHIAALQARGASAQVLAEFKAMDADAATPLPAYTLNTAADALMTLRQPEQARAMYQRALAVEPGNADSQTGLMYAQLEAENFPGVEEVVAQRLADTQGSPAARRTQVSALRFADQLQPAAAALQQLSAEFPDDAGLWLDQADLLSQRGLPRAAAERYRAVLARDPASIKARVGLANAVWAQGDIPEAAQMVEALQADAPEHPAVQRLQQAWLRNQRPLLTSSASWGYGAGRVTGNDERSSSTTLYSGQSAQGLRVYANYQQAHAQWWWDTAHLFQGSASHARDAMGLEWTRRDLQATAEVGTDLRNGHDAVWAAGAGWQVNDQLSLRARYESQTNDFPLKGRVPDVESNLGAPTYLHADKKTVGVAYRWNESRRIAADLSGYSFNDGNQRKSLAASWSERLYSGYGRTLDLQTAAYTSSNSLRDAVYFNPKRDVALSETLAADWLTWRRYERSFKQSLELSLGMYRQQSGDLGNNQTYGWNPFYGVHYAHEWQFGPDRSLRYGIGMRRFPYDGKYENSHSLDASLNWRF